MARRQGAQIAKVTIAEVFAQFLAEQRERLAPKTYAEYEDAIRLFQHSLNGYAYQTLNKAETRLFNRLYEAQGAEHREFCEVFGPEHILPNLGEFLDYFMVRKVIASKATLRAAGTVTKKLSKWLAAKGYVDGEDAEDAAERAGDAARDLPKADELSSDLYDFAESQDLGDEDERIEDHFTLTRVEPGKLWLEAMMSGKGIGPIEVPEDISRRCKLGWGISGIVSRGKEGWRFLETWNVYPA